MEFSDTSTTTFSVVEGKGERALREWEDRLANSNVTSRYLNATTVSTLLDAINHDDDFVMAAIVSLARPHVTHLDLMAAYRRGSGVIEAFMRPDRTDPNRLAGISNDLRTLADQSDPSRNGRVWALLAFACWASGDRSMMRQCSRRAAQLTAVGAYDPAARIPHSTDVLTVLMSMVIVMDDDDETHRRNMAEQRARGDRLIAQCDRELASLPVRKVEVQGVRVDGVRPLRLSVPELSPSVAQPERQYVTLDMSGLRS